MTEPAAPTEAIRFSHSGDRFVLGYGEDFFGIWDRTQPGGPIERFPRSDAGWEQAWREFTGRERRFVAVTAGVTTAPSGAAVGPGPGPGSSLRPTAAPARVTIGLIVLAAVLAVLTMAARAGLIARLDEFRRGAATAAGVVEAGDAVDALAVTTFVAIIAAAIAWIVWQYRAQANLHALGVPGLRFSPTAAAGWWWVPVANLVMPFLTVRELYVASRTDPNDPQAPRSSTPGVLAAWWAFWLARIPLGIAVAVLASSTLVTPDRLKLRAFLGLGTDAALVVAAVLAITIIRRIQRGQRAMQAQGQANATVAGAPTA